MFQLIALTPAGRPNPALAIAASRARGLGVLDLAYTRDPLEAQDAIAELTRLAPANTGVRLGTLYPEVARTIIANLPEAISTVVMTGTDRPALDDAIALLRLHREIWLEAVSIEEAELGEALGVDALIAKGHEAAGRVGDESTFVLLQRLLARRRLPVIAQGGIGLHTAAACYVAGARGVVLDAQLYLTRESPLPDDAQALIARMDGSETVVVGDPPQERHRLYSRPGGPGTTELTVAQHAGWSEPDQLWILGQDAAFAAPLARRFHTVGGIFEAVRRSIEDHVSAARRLKPLAEESPLARAQGTRFPIVQGPMTRVSDTPAFAKEVAAAGALPFFALALMTGPQVEALLGKAREALVGYPWGVGILGFVPEAVREEQLEVIARYRPSFALLAGGRPDQALVLERAGIPTYLHVPSPGLLRLFLDQGSRRFVFEGRECGGHVGPRSSFVLWDSMIDLLLDELPEAEFADCHVLFAGGIHDARSASMVATAAAPLAERGVKVGVLMGTAYLFTQEAVQSGAIVKHFQDIAIHCRGTVLLETGPGHATRCAPTPYVETFEHERRQLKNRGEPHERIRETLETLNLGRLRLAAKGVVRDSPSGERAALLRVDQDRQHREGMYMLGQVGALKDATTTIEVLHAEISQDSTALLDRVAEPQFSIPGSRPSPPADVAIIGMACNLPKAPDLERYWRNILEKVDAITEVPGDRWDWRRYFDSDPESPDRVNSKWGGFLEDMTFDPTLHGIPPSTLPSIEPLQLLTLEAVRAALEDAGYSSRPFPRDRTAVILGAGGGMADLALHYAARAALPQLLGDVPREVLSCLPEWTEDSFAGILLNVAAGRVANRFDLRGVNYTVDAACASSLAAVDLAVRELESGTSDMVIVGGADTVQNPFGYLCFSKTHALSPSGRCRTFDEEADGIAISEGLAVLVLKRLADAERDGDRIYAVIKGVGGSSDGHGAGLTAPRPEGQALALERAYAKAGFSPASVGLIEAHGTGTVAGDRAEVETLKRVFGAAGARSQQCAIGSVKSMIGHTKCTAGVAGLVKVALALHHRVLPATINVRRPNARANFAESPFFVNAENTPWLRDTSGLPRRAAVSAFGFGGINFHAVLEEYDRQLTATPIPLLIGWPSELLVWMAPSTSELLAEIDRTQAAISGGARPLLELAHGCWRRIRDDRRGSGGRRARLAVVASTVEDLRQKLTVARDALSSRSAVTTPGVYFSLETDAAPLKVAFLFPGQGSQFPGMLRELAMHFSEVRSSIELADRTLDDRLPRPLSSYIYPPPAFSQAEEQARSRDLTETYIAQPALGAIDIGAFRLLQAFGVRPDMVGGHSYGEYVALASANALAEEDLYRLSEARGRCMVADAARDPGSMAAVAAGRDRVSQLLGSSAGVWIANLNAPNQTVIAATRPGLEQALELLERNGIDARPLPVACAFHSPLMAGARDRFGQVLSTVPLSPPRIPVFSNTTASPHPDRAEEIRARLREHLEQPVLFSDEIEAMYEAGARVFVELGPKNVLSLLVDQILEGRRHLSLGLDAPGRAGLSQLQHLLGQLFIQGVALSLDRLFAGRIPASSGVVEANQAGSAERSSGTTWLVNGGRARPMAAAAPPVAVSVVQEAVMPNGSNGSIPADRSSHLPSVNGHEQAAIAEFQRLMSQFLDTQQRVMLAYLGGAPSPPASKPGSTIVQSTDELTTSSATSALPSEPVAAAVSPPGEQPTPSIDALTQSLLRIVSERTGYPAEMLGLDLNIEADLGIDSIKRLEIIGAFRKASLPGVKHPATAEMEKLTAIKTLRGIVTSMQSLAGPIAAGGSPPGSADIAGERPPAAASGPPVETAVLPRFVVRAVDAPV